MTNVVRPFISSCKARWIWNSVRMSTLAVASSRIRMGVDQEGPAMARRWRWPPERSHPRSPILVSNLRQLDELERLRRPSGAHDALRRRPGVAVGDVLRHRGGEEERLCITIPICRRRLCRSTSRTSCPSMRTTPEVTS